MMHFDFAPVVYQREGTVPRSGIATGKHTCPSIASLPSKSTRYPRCIWICIECPAMSDR